MLAIFWLKPNPSLNCSPLAEANGNEISGNFRQLHIMNGNELTSLIFYCKKKKNSLPSASANGTITIKRKEALAKLMRFPTRINKCRFSWFKSLYVNRIN
jgi:hypothetical protein